MKDRDQEKKEMWKKAQPNGRIMTGANQIILDDLIDHFLQFNCIHSYERSGAGGVSKKFK